MKEKKKQQRVYRKGAEHAYKVVTKGRMTSLVLNEEHFKKEKKEKKDVKEKSYVAPVIKKVDEDVWSVEWGGATVEFGYNFVDDKPFVAVYPDSDGCRVKTDVLMTYGKSVVSFARETPLPKVGDVVEITRKKVKRR